MALRPWGSGYFALLAFAVLLSAFDGERKPLNGGILAGIAWLGLAVPSLEGTIARVWWGFPALMGLLGIGWVLGGALAVWLVVRLPRLQPTSVLPILLVGSESVTSSRRLFGDAAVGLLAYTQADTVLRGVAAWSGASTVAVLTLLGGVSLYLLAQKRWLAGVGILGFALLLLMIPVPGSVRTVPLSTARVGAVQGAVQDLDRLLASYDQAKATRLFERYRALVEDAVAEGAEVVVLGETVLPRFTETSGLAAHVRNALSASPATILGAHESMATGTYNTAFVWSGDTLEPVYRKRSLVPIIESAYTPGTSSTPVMLQGALVGLGICLDTVHAGLVRESVLQGAELLVFLTDDTFAGSTSTPHVHLRTAALRAAETGRAVVFANESGPSAMFDPRGNVVAYLPHGEPGVVVAELPLAFGTTLFVALGDWLGWLCVVATAVLAGVAALRPRRLERDITSS